MKTIERLDVLIEQSHKEGLARDEIEDVLKAGPGSGGKFRLKIVGDKNARDEQGRQGIGETKWLSVDEKIIKRLAKLVR